MKNKNNIKMVPIHNWEIETDKIARYFAKKYFGNNPEQWWVADQIGGVYFVNDYFFDLNDIIDFLRYRYSSKKMFEYYDYALKIAESNYLGTKQYKDDKPICIRDYKKLKK